MKFTDEEIKIAPEHEWMSCGTHCQACDYTVNGVSLFHERTRVPWSPFKPMTVEQWTGIHGSKSDIEALARKHSGLALEEFYPDDPDNPGYFLAFNDSDKALAFCRSEDFDRLSLEKIT